MSFNLHDADANAKCQLCGDKAHTVRRGEVRDLPVCKGCAVEFLPEVIARAVLARSRRQDKNQNLHQAFARVHESY